MPINSVNSVWTDDETGSNKTQITGVGRMIWCWCDKELLLFSFNECYYMYFSTLWLSLPPVFGKIYERPNFLLCCVRYIHFRKWF